MLHLFFYDQFSAFYKLKDLLVGGVGKYRLEMSEEVLKGLFWCSSTLAGLATMELFWGGE